MTAKSGAVLVVAAIAGWSAGVAPDGRTSALTLLALVPAFLGATLAGARARAWCALTAGLVMSCLVLVAPSEWLLVFARAALLVAVLPTARREAAIMAGVSLVVPLALLAAAAATESSATLLATWSLGLPHHPLSWLTAAAAEIVVGALVFADRARSAFVSCAIVAVLLVTRARWVWSCASLPMEVRWFEGPFWVNQLKLDLGAPLYGPVADLNSYFYSPGLDRLHHALLAPFGLELSIRAHRVLTIIAQLAGGGVLALALRPKGAIATALLFLAITSSFIAPTVHPDHVGGACLAFAYMLVLAEERFPRALWWTAIALLAPLASLFKMTWAGIGLGLALAFAVTGRRRPALVALGSVGFAALLVVAGGAAWPTFRFWTVDLPRAQPLEWWRLGELAVSPQVLFFALAVVIVGVTARRERRVWAALALAAGAAVLTVPAFLKHAGREHNLQPLLVGAASALILLSARGGRPLPLALLALGVAWVGHPLVPLGQAERAGVAQQAALVSDLVRAERHAGRRTLLVAHVTALAHDELPRDRAATALELFVAGRPEAEVFFAHLEAGTYDTVVAPKFLLVPGTSPTGRFQARLGEALAHRYDEDTTTDPDLRVFRLRSARPR